jgi:hypothetical protein
VKVINEVSMIYFIRQAETNYIKIGYTGGDVYKRLATLQTGSPHKLKIMFVINGDRNREKKLHSLFSDYFISGEWFDMPEYKLIQFYNEQDDYYPQYFNYNVLHERLNIIQTDDMKLDNIVSRVYKNKSIELVPFEEWWFIAGVAGIGMWQHRNNKLIKYQTLRRYEGKIDKWRLSKPINLWGLDYKLSFLNQVVCDNLFLFSLEALSRDDRYNPLHDEKIYMKNPKMLDVVMNEYYR